MRPVAQFLLISAALFVATAQLFAGELKFRMEEPDTRLAVGYAVRLIDMNDDGKQDIVIVDSKRFLWLENPTWKEHVMHEDTQARFDNVCFAPADIDQDGDLDFAVGRDWQFTNTKSGGTIGWLEQGEKLADPWRYHPIGEEPTTHRMRFADLDDDGRPELVVAPLKGRNTTNADLTAQGVRLLSYTIPNAPAKEGWPVEVISDKLHVMHNFWHCDINGDKQIDLLCASFEGVTLLQRQKNGKWLSSHIGEGNQEKSNSRGASEIKLGRFASKMPYIATIEPWHGHQVVVYAHPETNEENNYRGKWQRHVVDDDLKWGHAVWCANLDDDADEELIIGVRDNKDNTYRCGLRIYDATNDSGGGWKRHIIDPGGVNIEDLAAGDLNGDGKIDIVAVGRQSHNVRIYWNETE